MPISDAENAQRAETRQVLLAAIRQMAPNAGPEGLKHLAEAYAWVVSRFKADDDERPRSV